MPTVVLPPLLRGLGLTLVLWAGGATLAAIVALFAGVARTSRRRWVRIPVIGFVEVFRGASTLVLLYWFFFVLPDFGLHLGAIWCGILVLGLNVGAYGSEVVRGSLESIPREQQEAARALHFTPRQRLWRILLPQALPSILPPAGNLAIELLKASSLVSLITLADLTFVAKTLRADTMRTTEIFLLVLMLYFAAAQLINLGFRQLERQLPGFQERRAR